VSCPRTQQVKLFAISNCPFNAERQAGNWES